jgi:hypothetical protein
MKKIVCAGLIFMAAAFSAQAIGLYFDVGLGFGPAWTEMDGKDVVKAVTRKTSDEMALDIGLKAGLGPFETIPVYVVGALGGIGHRIYNSPNDYYQFNAYLLGPGVIYYPTPFLQIAASLGYSFVANVTSFATKEYMNESKGGFAGDVSVAFDLGAGNHGLLGGVRFFGSTNTLEKSGAVQNSSMLSVFLRYAFRQKR